MVSHFRFGILFLVATVIAIPPKMSALELETVSPGAPDRVGRGREALPDLYLGDGPRGGVLRARRVPAS